MKDEKGERSVKRTAFASAKTTGAKRRKPSLPLEGGSRRKRDGKNWAVESSNANKNVNHDKHDKKQGKTRHSRESGNPVPYPPQPEGLPIQIQSQLKFKECGASRRSVTPWIPAFAGMTKVCGRVIQKHAPRGKFGAEPGTFPRKDNPQPRSDAALESPCILA